MDLELIDEQKKAIKSLERAFKKCEIANIYFHNCYGTLIAYDGNVVDHVDNGELGYSQHAIEANEGLLDCSEGVTVSISYSLDSYADDKHYVHLKD